MKVLMFGFIIYVHFVNSYKVDYVPAVVGSINLVKFDSDGNIYAASRVSSTEDAGTEYNRTLYILSPERELISTVHLPSTIDTIQKMHITKEKDIYFYFSTTTEDPLVYNNTFAILRSGSDTVEVVDQILYNFFFLDPYDNLYYGRETGLHLLRPGSNTPVQIKNLEDYFVNIPDKAAIDGEGNVYFAVGNEHDNFNISLVLRTKKELQNELPQAQFMKIQDDHYETVFDIISDERDNIWVSTRLAYNDEGFIKKLENGTQEIIKTDQVRPNLLLTAVKDRIWVVAANAFKLIRPMIYFITLDDRIVDIPELQNLTEQMYFTAAVVTDNDGTTYMWTYKEFNPALGSIIIINPGEDKPIPVKFAPNVSGLTLDGIFMDVDENVWVIGHQSSIDYYYYVIKKGETTANIVSGVDDYCTAVHPNPVTKEVFLECFNGLMVAVNEN